MQRELLEYETDDIYRKLKKSKWVVVLPSVLALSEQALQVSKDMPIHGKRLRIWTGSRVEWAKDLGQYLAVRTKLVFSGNEEL